MVANFDTTALTLKLLILPKINITSLPLANSFTFFISLGQSILKNTISKALQMSKFQQLFYFSKLISAYRYLHSLKMSFASGVRSDGFTQLLIVFPCNSRYAWRKCAKTS